MAPKSIKGARRSSAHWLVAAAAIACTTVVSAGAASRPAEPPAVVGLTSVGGRWALRPLDPRTLAPVRGSWSHRISRDAVLVRSPRGTGVVAAVSDEAEIAVVLDTRTGRVVRRYDEWAKPTLYWLAGELPLRSRGGPLLLGEIESCWSNGCGTEYAAAGSGCDTGYELETVAVLRAQLVVRDEGIATLAPRPGWCDFLIDDIPLPRVPSELPWQVVSNVAADRLFVVSSSGVVARIDRASSRPRVTYHRVTLNGRGFSAAWAGRGRIALWGEDGLGMIDTRTWTTKSVAPVADGVVVTAFGIAVWVDGTPGVTVYRPDGTLRFRVLESATVRSAETVGRYLYVRAGRRYAIDMREGRVVGRARSDARLALPSFVALP